MSYATYRYPRALNLFRTCSTRRGVTVAAWAVVIAVALVQTLMLSGCGGAEDVEKIADEDEVKPAKGDVIGSVETILGRVDGTSGVTVTACADPACKAASAEPGTKIREGGTVETDELSRVRLRLDDGTILALDTRTAIRMKGPRDFDLVRGEVYADVAPAGGLAKLPEATFASAAAEVVVKGTKLSLSAGEGATRVVVSRGEVEMRTDKGAVSIGAGREGRAKRGEIPSVIAAPNLSHVRDWARSLERPVYSDDDSPGRGIGTLVARRAGESVEKKPRPLELAAHRVKATIRGAVARTEVVEEFFNPTDAVLEGTYEFPVPSGATITRLALWVGDRLEEGEIVETARAEAIFRSIVEDTVRNRDPALLKWKSGSTFSMKIFPIPAHGSRKVLIEYTEVLEARYGRYKYVYPLARTGSDPVGEFAIDVDLDVGGPLGEVGTPRWPAAVKRTATGARATFEAKSFLPKADFALEFSGQEEGAEAAVATYESKDGHRYFLASLRPELPETPMPERRDYVFIVDTSYGVAADAFDAQTATIAGFLAEMSIQDRFKVLACDVTCRAYSDEFREPRPEEIDDVVAFVKRVGPGGSSNLDGAFEVAAKAVASSGAKAASPRIVYIGDGVATAGALRADLLLDRIASHLEPLPGVRIDVVGVGADVDRLVLDEIARRFGGAARYVVAGGDAVRAALEIVAAQYTPAIADASIEIHSKRGSRVMVDPDGVYPKLLPTVQEGDELLITGRFEGEGDAELVLRGRVAGKEFEKTYEVALRTDDTTAKNAFLPGVWGRARLDELSMEDPVGYKDEIIKTSFETSVMSRYTAFLVLENERMYREFKVARKTDRDRWDPTDAPEFADATKTAEATSDEKSADKSEAEEKEPPSGLAPMFGAKGKGASAGAPGPGKGDMAGVEALGGASGASTSKRPPAEHAAPRATTAGDMGERRRSKGIAIDSFDDEDMGADDDLDVVLESGSVAASESEKRAASGRKAGATAPVKKPMRRAAAPVAAAAAPSADREASEDMMPAAEPRGAATRVHPDYHKEKDGKRKAKKVVAEKKMMIDPRPKAKPVAKRPSKPMPDMIGDGGFGPGIGYSRPPPPPRYSTVIRPAPPPSSSPAVLHKLEEVRAAIGASPNSRKARERLVRALVKYGRYDEARGATEQWLADDIGSTKPLEFMGDLSVVSGDVTAAIRYYDSIAELTPKNAKLHLRLAAMHGAKGEAPAACAHLRSAMELATGATRKRAVAALARCESEATGVAKRRPRARGEVVVELRWDGDADLDVSLVPPKADRLGALKPVRGVKVVYDAHSGSEGAELLQAKRIGRGRYLVGVTAVGGPLPTAVKGHLVVRSHGSVKKLPFTIPSGSSSVEIATFRKIVHYYR